MLFLIAFSILKVASRDLKQTWGNCAAAKLELLALGGYVALLKTAYISLSLKVSTQMQPHVTSQSNGLTPFLHEVYRGD